jgi:hypothetical protein
MRIQYNELNQVIGHGEISGEMTAEVAHIDGNYFDYDYVNGQLVRMRWSDWEYQTNFKIKMNSDRFVAMVSEVNAIVTDVSKNVSMFGITEIYLDVIDDEFRTLVTYFGGEIYDRTKN